MTCDEFAPFIDAYVDQELDEQDLIEMEVHLATCESCREHVAVQLKLKEEFKAALGGVKAPDALRERIFADLEDALGDYEHEEPESNVVPIRDAAPASRRGWARVSMVLAPVAAAIALLVFVPNLTVAPAGSDPLPVVEQTVDWHRGNFPIEVTGPEEETVTRWFRNKVDFPVRPPQFASSERVNLLGGRIANVQDRRAAYLVYEVDGTRLSVMVFDGEGLTVPADRIRSIEGRDVLIANQQGYEVALLQDNGLTYALTSELPEERFVSLVSGSMK